jgi:uncharacterized RDD family membrane protein YckC
MGHDVIISYATIDKPIADAVCAKLEERGIRCWIAPRDILAGMDYAEAIISAIDSAKLMVLIFSSHANASKHVMREAERAVHDGYPIIPVRIEDVQPTLSLQYYISAQHWLDALTPPLEQHILKLAETVSVLLGKPIPPPTQETPPQPPEPSAQRASTESRDSYAEYHAPPPEPSAQRASTESRDSYAEYHAPPPEPSAQRASTESRDSYAEYHAPPLQQPPAASPYKGVPIRYGAVVIDWVVILVIWFFGYLILYSVSSSLALSDIFFLGWPLCVYLLYFIALEGTYGQTIGKKATRIKVVKEDGSPITYREAVIRTFVGVVDGLPIIIPGLIGCIVIWRSDKKQRIGDLAAHTVVVAKDATMALS